MNRIELMGRLTADPELKKSEKEKAKTYARFSLAVPRKLEKDTVDFFDCVVFGRVAEALQKYCKKGNRIIVTGTIQTGSYENKDGVKIKTYTVLGEDFYFTENAKKDEKKEEKKKKDEKAEDADDDYLPF